LFCVVGVLTSVKYIIRILILYYQIRDENGGDECLRSQDFCGIRINSTHTLIHSTLDHDMCQAEAAAEMFKIKY